MICQKGRKTQLFVAVRRIKLKPGAVDEYVRRVEVGAIPQMREMDGFRSFQVMKEDDGTAADDGTGVARSGTEVLADVKARLAGFDPGPNCEISFSRKPAA